jgi:hypothetical protein
MSEDSLSEAQQLCDKQKSFNAEYFDFFNITCRTSALVGALYAEVIDAIMSSIEEGHTERALKHLNSIKDLLAKQSQQEIDALHMHHRYVSEAVNSYRVITKALLDYSRERGDEHIAKVAEMQLAGIEDFSLAGIASLDPD